MNYDPKEVSYKIVVFEDGTWTTEDGNGNEIGKVVQLSEYQDPKDGILRGICERRTFVEYTRNSPQLICRGNYCRWI